MTARVGAAVGTVRMQDGVAVASAVGEIDVSTVADFQALVDQAVALGTGGVRVDLRNVDFIDGRAVTVLAAAANVVRRSGARLSVTGSSMWIYRVFEITGLTDLVDIAPPVGGPAHFVQHIARSADAPVTRQLLDASLKLVVTMAQAVLSAADGVSITLPRDQVFVTVAHSNDVVLEMDHDQYDTGEGPCLDAATQGERFLVESLSEEARWPAFTPRALARGIESILSTPLVADGVPIGALNVYSKRANAFAVHESRWTDQFAAEAASIVSVARTDKQRDTLTAQIEQALLSREVIALAQGMVMQRDGVSQAAAHGVLRTMSRSSSRPLRDICEDLVRPGHLNQELSDGGAHGNTTQ